MIQNKKIILSPLDWGLGHTTRCIPLIRTLQAQGNEVWVAGNAMQQSLLHSELGDFPFLTLEGYNVQYAKKPNQLAWVLAKQMPKIWKSVHAEHRWLDAQIKAHGFDLVISDNRFGFYSKQVESIFITHQLNIQAPNSLLQIIANFCNHYYIHQFNRCWVPDYAGSVLSGQLSRAKLRIPIEFIGPLSRFNAPASPVETSLELLVILSGPEPQRTLLEEKVLRELAHWPGRKVLLRGKPKDAINIPLNGFEVYAHLNTEAMQTMLWQARCIISRAGYTSIMDYDALGKTALLIPTPGQTEQEYLAQRLYASGKFGMAKQEDDLGEALQHFLPC